MLLLSGNWRALFITTLVVVLWTESLKLVGTAFSIPSWILRKILHIFTGPIFLLTWPLFSDDQIGAYFAASVPAIMTLKFVLVGVGAMKDDEMVRISSRSGRRIELLYGPLQYGVIFIASTILFWKSVSGIIYLFILCFGDGMAEVFGRSFGEKNKLFWSGNKSWAGMFGFIVSAYFSTHLFLSFYGPILFSSLPSQFYQLSRLKARLLMDVLFAALIETIPVTDVDNLTVFLSVALFDYWRIN